MQIGRAVAIGLVQLLHACIIHMHIRLNEGEFLSARPAFTSAFQFTGDTLLPEFWRHPQRNDVANFEVRGVRLHRDDVETNNAWPIHRDFKKIGGRQRLQIFQPRRCRVLIHYEAWIEV